MTEKRIYVILPTTIDCLKGRVVQPLGRQVAQACHATNEMRREEKFTKVMTTIILQARDFKEVAHVCYLMRKKSIQYYFFYDQNPEYGPGEYPSAVCTAPVEPFKVEPILGYLPLWPSA